MYYGMGYCYDRINYAVLGGGRRFGDFEAFES